MEEVLVNQKSLRTIKALAWIITIITVLGTAAIVYACIKNGLFSLLF